MDSRRFDPYANYAVLQQVANVCPFNTLKNFRLVSRSWNSCANKGWRRRARMVVQNSENEEMTGFPLESLLESISNNQDADLYRLQLTPYKSFGVARKESITSSHLTMMYLTQNAKQLILCDDVTFEDIAEILLVLSNVTDLKIEGKFLPSEADPRRFRKFQPNIAVKSLEMVLNPEDHAVPWFHILLRMCRIKSAKFSLFQSENRNHLQQLLAGIAKMRSNARFCKSLLNLKSLFIEAYAPAERASIPSMFSVCNFYDLRELGLDFEEWIDVTYIAQLILHYASTLQTFRYNFKAFQQPNYVFDESAMSDLLTVKPITSMTKLRTMRIINGLLWPFVLLRYLEVNRLDSLQIIANDSDTLNMDLREIVCKETRMVQVGMLGTVLQGRCFENLREFVYTHHWKFLSCSDVAALGKAMPSLQLLRMPLTAHTFRTTCANFPNLKELDICICHQLDYAEIDDAAIVGATVLRTSSHEKPDCTEFRKPNITNLAGLGRLTISCARMLMREAVTFTDITVEHGLLHLLHLKYVSMSFQKISREMTEKLVEHGVTLKDQKRTDVCNGSENCTCEIETV